MSINLQKIRLVGGELIKEIFVEMLILLSHSGFFNNFRFLISSAWQKLDIYNRSYGFDIIRLQHRKKDLGKPFLQVMPFHHGNYDKVVFEGKLFQFPNFKVMIRDIRVKRQIGRFAPYCGPKFEGF